MTNVDPGATPPRPKLPPPSLQDQVLALEVAVQLLMGILAGTGIVNGKRIASALEQIADSPAFQSQPGVAQVLRRLALAPGADK